MAGGEGGLAEEGVVGEENLLSATEWDLVLNCLQRNGINRETWGEELGHTKNLNLKHIW